MAENIRIIFSVLWFLLLISSIANASKEDMGNGFYHHGVATPVSNHRGIVATTDNQKNNIVLIWLFDCRGGYALLLIDTQNEKAEEFKMPFNPAGDCPYASILSSQNKFYTHFNSHFVEFDPEQKAFTFVQKTTPQMAMGMVEDDRGRIWAITYPQSGVICFDPETKQLRDYGHVYQQNWPQYQRYVAADDKGWIYFGVGNTASQIIILNPETGQVTPVLNENERILGSGYVVRDCNGKVYGHNGSGEKWFELYQGIATPLSTPPTIQEKLQITGSQALFHKQFPDGSEIITCDLVEKILVIKDSKTNQTRSIHFDYTSEGANIMSVAAAPNNTICGGTTFPMRFFSYDPATDTWINREAYNQWNTVARQGDLFYVGGYPHGFLLEWNPSKEWINTEKDNPNSNPCFLIQADPDIYRPHELLPFRNGKTLALAGTPGYGYTGGGLLLWDTQLRQSTLLKHEQLIPNHSIMSMVEIDEHTILAGTTIAPGTGGEQKAQNAELFLLDLKENTIIWREAIFPIINEFTDLYFDTDTKIVFGIADRHLFFAFDPFQRKVIKQIECETICSLTNYQQGPRVFVRGPQNRTFILFVKGIGEIIIPSYDIQVIATSPIPIGAGGDFLDGNIYFASGSHLYSYKLPTNE